MGALGGGYETAGNANVNTNLEIRKRGRYAARFG
jgi:hypothetical protein